MTKKSISAHQLGVISGILLLTLKMTSLPSLMYEYGQTGGILNVIAFIGFDFLFLYLIILVKRIFPKTTLYEILKKYLGVFITKLLYVIFFLFFIFKILSIMSDSFTFIKDVVDEDFSIVKVFICFLPVISYLAFTGIRNIARTSEFFFPAIIVCLVVISVFAFVPIDSWELGDITRAGFGNFMESFFRLSFWTGDLFALLLFFDKIEIKKEETKKAFAPLVILSFFYLIGMFVYFLVYQQTAIYHTNAIVDVLQYAVGATNGWRMDIFSIICYMLCVFIQSAIFMFCASESLKKLFNYKFSKVRIIFINIVLVVAEYLFLTDYLKYVVFAKNILCYFSTITMFLIPLIMIIILIKGGRNEKKWL